MLNRNGDEAVIFKSVIQSFVFKSVIVTSEAGIRSPWVHIFSCQYFPRFSLNIQLQSLAIAVYS